MRKPFSRKKKIGIAVICIVLVLMLTFTAAVPICLYEFALKPGGMMRFIDPSMVFSDDAQVTAISEKSPFGRSADNEWLTAVATDAFITSEDGLLLHAYYGKTESYSNKYAIVIHGYSANALTMSYYAKRFYDMGYNVLLPDLRGHGESEGDYIGMGWDDRLDILDWIDYIILSDPDARIILHGVSMGGATVMMTSGEELPSNVVLAIEDCGYSSVWDEFSAQLGSMFHLPDFPFLYLAQAVCKVRAGYGFKEASAVEQVKKCKIPMLFIHGDKDAFVPYEMLDKVYEAATCPKQRLDVKGADHAMSCAMDPELYWSTIEGFINTYDK